MAIAWHRVTIKQNDKIVREVTVPWPDDESPNPYLNDVMQRWEAEQKAPCLAPTSYRSRKYSAPLRLRSVNGFPNPASSLA